jgi:flavin reductase (DIM6/NTAB) family NADH-FMN oxidoreductase RutF
VFGEQGTVCAWDDVSEFPVRFQASRRRLRWPSIQPFPRICDIDKFKVFRLTPAAASLVKAPLIDECYANLECKVVDTRMVAKYNFFILEVQKAWIAPSTKPRRTIHHLGKGMFMVAGRTIKLPSKMI